MSKSRCIIELFGFCKLGNSLYELDRTNLENLIWINSYCKVKAVQAVQSVTSNFWVLFLRGLHSNTLFFKHLLTQTYKRFFNADKETSPCRYFRKVVRCDKQQDFTKTQFPWGFLRESAFLPQNMTSQRYELHVVSQFRGNSERETAIRLASWTESNSKLLVDHECYSILSTVAIIL